MKKILYLLVIPLCISACNPYHFDENASIELKKDPCFGVCPVYSFKLDGKGNAIFSGTRNVQKMGDWSRRVSPDLTNEIFTAFEQSNFAQFQDEYTAQVTDLPTTWISFKYGTIDKTIKDYYGSPEALKKLEAMVEKVAEEDTEWIKSEEAPSN